MRIALLLSLTLLFVGCSAPAPRTTAAAPETDGRLGLLQRRLETVEQGMIVLQRQLEDQSALLANLDRQLTEKTIGTSPPDIADTEPEISPEEQLRDERNRQAARDYLAAFTELSRGRYPEAANGFQQFMATYPDNQYAGNALFWLGECQLAQRELTAAADTFRQVPERYPEASKSPEALLKLATIYRQLGQNDKAMQALSLLQMNYPDSPAVKRAGTIFN